MVDRYELISVVDRPRPGLVDHSRALVDRARAVGWLSAHRATARTFDCGWIREILLLTAATPATVLVVWSNGLSSLLLCMFLRVLRRRVRVLVVHHEPGGLRQRLSKGDGVGYALSITAYEWLRRPLVSRFVYPSPAAAAGKPGRRYAPLPFAEPTFDALPQGFTVLHLGRIDPRRSSDVLARISPALQEVGVTVEYFPRRGHTSHTVKVEALARASLVFNPYRIAYNVSGVTCEAIAYGVPVLVSTFDPYAPMLEAVDPALVVPADRITDECLLQHIVALCRAAGTGRSSPLRAGIERMAAREFGVEAFDTWWRPVIAELLAEVW